MVEFVIVVETVVLVDCGSAVRDCLSGYCGDGDACIIGGGGCGSGSYCRFRLIVDAIVVSVLVVVVTVAKVVVCGRDFV
jgi:hypothetical protein